MTTYYINTTTAAPAEKISLYLNSMGFQFASEKVDPPKISSVKVDVSKKLYKFQEWGCAPCEELVTLEKLKLLLSGQIPKPSYEWLEKQCASLKKQLLALGYEDRGGEMMAPPEYILNDLTPELAIQAFKDGKSVTVAGKPMTSGTTIEELLDSRLTLKHKRFGRIVLTDQVTAAPEVGTPVFYESIDKEVIEDKFATYMLGLLGSGCLHYTEQGAIDHAKEMARLNRDGFVEMDVEWLVKLKNELSTVLYSIEEKQLLEASRRIGDVMDEISKKIGEFY